MNNSIEIHGGAIHGAVTIPGSKSYTNRALLLAAFTKGPVRVESPLMSDDIEAMIDCLRALGIQVTTEEGAIIVHGSYADITDKEYTLNARLSGTTIRFILPLLAFTPGIKNVTGEAGLNKRPIKDLVDALREMGADISYTHIDGYPPLRIQGVTTLKKNTCSVKGDTSSQYLSALLMSAPICGGYGVRIEGNLVSKPYVDMTIDTMKHFGVTTTYDAATATYTTHGTYAATAYQVEGDYSSAGYFFALAALTRSELVLHNLTEASLQPDKKILDVCTAMGAQVTFAERSVTIRGAGIVPMEIDMLEFPDQAQTLAVVAAFAQGKTVLRNVQSLRVKETERVKALETELQKMGIRTESTPDTLTVYGGNPRPARISTYGDHRMAMSFAVAGALLRGLEIEHPEVVEKTFPTFFTVATQVGLTHTNAVEKHIFLIGMRGSGKSTVGKALAQRLNRAFVETDELIVWNEGKSIPEIVSAHGWEHFRRLEHDALRSVVAKDASIIATGGGVVLKEENRNLLQRGVVVLLDAPTEQLAARIRHDTNRPRLTTEQSLEQELDRVRDERGEFYATLADMRFETHHMSVEEVVDAVLNTGLFSKIT
jgi:3-phosphoshikimate 1-carboxyvinyltransferase